MNAKRAHALLLKAEFKLMSEVLGVLVANRRREDRRFSQKAIASELADLKGTKTEVEESFLSSLLKGHDRGINRYLDVDADTQRKVLDVLGRQFDLLGEQVVVLVRDRARSHSLGHPAWQEMGDDTSWHVLRVSGLPIEADLVRRILRLGWGEALVICGSAGSGKSALLRRLEKAVAADGSRPHIEFIDKDSGRASADAAAGGDPSIGPRVMVVSGHLAPSERVHVVELQSWGPTEVECLLVGLAKAADLHAGCPKPGPEVTAWLLRHLPPPSFRNPRDLGFLARILTETLSLGGTEPDFAQLLLEARFRAARCRTPDRSPDSATLKAAFDAVVEASLVGASPGLLRRGVPSAALERALQNIPPRRSETLDQTLDSVESSLRTKGAKSRKHALESVQDLRKQLGRPGAAVLLEAIEASGLLVRDGDSLRPLEGEPTDSVGAAGLSARSDAWVLLCGSLMDPTREAMRLATARRLTVTEAQFQELLSTGPGRHGPALRLALEFLAFGPADVSPGIALRVLSSVCAVVLWTWPLRLLPADQAVREALRVASRRYHGTLQPLPSATALEAILASAAPDTQRLVGSVKECWGAWCEAAGMGASPSAAMCLPSDTNEVQLLARLLPWQLPEEVLSLSVSGRATDGAEFEDVLWRLAEHGHTEAQRLWAGGGVTDDERGWHARRGFRRRCEGLANWGPKEQPEYLCRLSALVAEASRPRLGLSSIESEAEVLTLKAISTFLRRFPENKFPPTMKDRLGFRVPAEVRLWCRGFEKAKARDHLSLERQRLLAQAAMSWTPDPKHHGRLLLEISGSLHRLGVTEPLRELASGRWPAFPSAPSGLGAMAEGAVSPSGALVREAAAALQREALDELSMEAATVLVEARDVEGLRTALGCEGEGPEGGQSSPARRALERACEDTSVAVWAVDTVHDLGSAWCVLKAPLAAGPYRDAVLRWASSPDTDEGLRRKAAVALLQSPLPGEVDAVSWLFGGEVSCDRLECGLRHPDHGVRAEALVALVRTAEAALANAPNGAAAFQALLSALRSPPGSLRPDPRPHDIQRLIRCVAAARTPGAPSLEALNAVFSLVQAAASAGARNEVADVLAECVKALRPYMEAIAWRGLVLNPLPQGPTKESEVMRDRVVLRVGPGQIDDLALIEALERIDMWAVAATKRRLELLPTPTADLVREAGRAGLGLVEGGNPRIEAVGSVLRARAPGEWARLMADALSQHRPSDLAIANLWRSTVQAADPEAGARYLEALLGFSKTERQGRGRSP